MSTIAAAKSVAWKWAQNLPVHWTLSDLFPEGKEKNSSHQINLSDYHLFIWQNLYLYIFFTFRYYKNKSLRLSDTVSLKKKNVKYTTALNNKKVRWLLALDATEPVSEPHFSTAKEISVDTTSNNFWNDAEILLKSFWTSHLQMMVY